MTPVIKNARIASLHYGRQLVPRRGERRPMQQANKDSIALHGEPLENVLPGMDYATDVGRPAAEVDQPGLAAAANQAPMQDSARAPAASTEVACPAASAADSAADPAAAAAPAADSVAYRAAYQQGCEDGRQQGLQAGFEQGREQGLQEGRAQATQEFDLECRTQARRALQAHEAGAAALQALRVQLQEADASLQAKAELLAVDIAWTALMRLLADAAGKREAVAGMVRAVLGESRSQEILRIGLAQSDLALLQAELPPDFASFSLLADARVQSGGCIVETVAGALDGRLETRLHALRQLLLSQQEAAGGDAP